MPVKLSDNLVGAARVEAKTTDRSITAQIEHWVTIGRAVEAALSHNDLLELKQHEGNLKQAFTNATKREQVRGGEGASHFDRFDLIREI